MQKVVNININNWSGSRHNSYDWSISNYWNFEKYFIDETESKSVIDLFNQIRTQDKALPKKGDVIYASKASEIPRFKLKEFIKDNNLKKTSRVAMSSLVIINRGYFETLYKRIKLEEYTFVNEDKLGSIVSKKRKDLNEYVMNIINNTKNNNQLGLITNNENDLKKIFSKDQVIKAEFETKTNKYNGIYLDLYRENRLLELLNIIIENASLIQSGKMKFIFDEDFFVELNKEGIELDDDYLQTLRDMLFSSDKANVALGFEMMSNLVIDQPTLLSLSFLLNELYHQTNFRPSYFTSGNSNLRSLLKLFTTKGIHWERDWKTFGTGLRLNFKDGKEGEIVKKFLLDNINREFKLTNSAAESLVDIVFVTEAK